MKIIAKHAKRAVLFHIKNNETCETGRFAKQEILRNGQLVSRNNKTRFASRFGNYEAKRVSLETLHKTFVLVLYSIVHYLFDFKHSHTKCCYKKFWYGVITFSWRDNVLASFNILSINELYF
jgi:hypothetical protein